MNTSAEIEISLTEECLLMMIEPESWILQKIILDMSMRGYRLHRKYQDQRTCEVSLVFIPVEAVLAEKEAQEGIALPPRLKTLPTQPQHP